MTPHYKKELQEIANKHGYSVRSEERLNALSDKFLGQVSTEGCIVLVRMSVMRIPFVLVDT